MKKAIIIGMCAAMTATSFTSCLDTESDRFVEGGDQIGAQDSVFRFLSILNGVKTLGNRMVLLGELRGDLMATTEYANLEERAISNWTLKDNLTNKYLSQREYYNVINQCNYIIKYGAALPKEQAAATALRAWTYLQLVLNYGEAAYYEQPIMSEGEAKAQYPKYKLDEMVDVLIPQLEAIREVPLPSYGALDGVSIASQLFDVKFLLGDLYLWRGQSGDYERAATLYHTLINGTNTNVFRYATFALEVDGATYTPYITGGALNGYKATDVLQRNFYMNARMNKTGMIKDWNRNLAFETISGIDYLTGTAAIPCNLDSLSGVTFLNSIDENAREAIRLTATPVLSTLFSTTRYAYVEDEASYVQSAFDNFRQPITDVDYAFGDLRLASTYDPYPGTMTVTSTRTDSLVAKYMIGDGSRTFSRKRVTVFRNGMLYLRYAEAVNRAGKPGLAMIALKYGLNRNNVRYYMPASEKPATLTYDIQWYNDAPGGVQPVFRNMVPAPIYNEAGQQIGTHVYDGSMNTLTLDEAYQDIMDAYLQADNQSCFHLPIKSVTVGDEKRLTLLSADAVADTAAYCFKNTLPGYCDFVSAMDINVGLHWRGAGCASADESFVMPHKKYTTLEDQQQYMDSVICNEYALETAFEGGRFYDLMRFAKHEQDPTFLAKRVAAKFGSNSQTYYNLLMEGRRGWDCTSWYLPRMKGEK